MRPSHPAILGVFLISSDITRGLANPLIITKRHFEMTIDSVTATILSSYEYPHGGWVLVRVRTEEGVEGIGECFVPHQAGRGAFSAKSIIEECLAPVVISGRVLDTSRLWEAMYDVCGSLYDQRGMAVHALSGMDMAIHDAAVRSMGVPLYDLLGGSHRSRIRVYVSSV